MPNQVALINQTKKWLSSVIIAQGLCPFARREFDGETIHYEVIETAETSAQLECVLAQCEALDADKSRETSLLIFPNGLDDFEDYLDLLEIANALLAAEGYEGIYQLASFHPDYRFEGAPEDDACHYTNRSPYPMLHILREVSVEQAIKTHPNPEKIPERNITLTRELGLKAMQDLLAACYK
ncbi:MAG: DUF1415 domain-containing protein [Maricaulaceae bacterium]